MKRIYLFVVCILFYHGAAAQTILTGTPALSVRSLDSADAEIEAIKNITKSDSMLIVLSAADTGLKYSSDSTSINKNTCIISFIGCDESHIIMSDFTNYFYTEYLKTSNKEASFFRAKAYLFNKYPDSPVTPILRCG